MSTAAVTNFIRNNSYNKSKKALLRQNSSGSNKQKTNGGGGETAANNTSNSSPSAAQRRLTDEPCSDNSIQESQPESAAKTCCFCWCCCCSCSCLNVRNNKQEDTSKPSGNSQIAKDHSGFDLDRISVTEAQMWSESFDRLMLSTEGRSIFREFLKTEYSEENILFWLACEELKKESNPETVEEKARVIYEDYISILSPKEVSLDSRVREIINKNMVEPTLQTFDDAQVQIYTLMHRDSYPRFLNSKLYRDLIKESSVTLESNS